MLNDNVTTPYPRLQLDGSVYLLSVSFSDMHSVDHFAFSNLTR